MVELCLVAGAAVGGRCKNLCIRLMANNVRYIFAREHQPWIRIIQKSVRYTVLRRNNIEKSHVEYIIINLCFLLLLFYLREWKHKRITSKKKIKSRHNLHLESALFQRYRRVHCGDNGLLVWRGKRRAVYWIHNKICAIYWQHRGWRELNGW